MPLDRSGVVPGAIRIRAARIRSRRPTRPPIIGLTGGPGQAGVYFIADYAFLLPTRGRDLVLLDQRGTGASGLLRCPSIEHKFKTTFERAAAACAKRLGVRRSFYTSADSAADIEALRIRLGAPKIALYAISYGTRVATEYARRYPDRVERMILDSTIGNDAPDGLARETLEAVPRVLRSVCRIGCGGAQAHPVADMRRLVKRLRKAPIRRTVRGGRRVRVDADDLLGLLVSSDVDTAFMRRIPPAVRSALGGNAGPLVRLKARFGGEDDDRPSEFSSAVYAATTCEESFFPWDPSAPRQARRAQARAAAAATPDAAFGPFDRTAALHFGLLSTCGSWPAPERVMAPPPPLPTTVPTLVLAGELDLRTPLENARRLTQALGGKLVVERGVGHQVLGSDPNGCAMPAVESFLAGHGVPACRRDASISIARAVARRAPPAALR